jgi:hypothetical protein
VSEFEYDFRRLRSELDDDVRRLGDELRYEMESTRSELESLSATTVETYEELQQRCSAVETAADDALRQVHHVAAWLARYSRPGMPRAVVADPTDRPATGLLTLALKADQAVHLSEQLLTDQVRTGLRADVVRHQDWQQARAAAEAAAIKASKTVADTGAKDPEHVAAAAAFTRAHDELTRLDRIRDQIEQRAQSARSRLAADEEARSEHEYSIADGVQAGIDLRAAIEEQILDAREADALFAPWFTGCFGFTPQGPDWLDLAVEVCAYRITYNISSEKPLGPPPTSDSSTTRRAWHGDLLRQLVDHRAILP